MTINSRPQRDDAERASSFIERATEVETAKLQCWIPADLHQWLKFTAVEDHTNMTALVIQALEDYRTRRQS